MEFNFNDIIEHTPRAPPEMKAFDVQLLLSSIHQTDDLVRKYSTKCDENKQLQENLVSLNDLSIQIRQLYASEKEKNENLTLDKQKVNDENRQLKADLAAIQHEQINNETLQKQTIAELEYQLETVAKDSSAKYVELCESFVAQGLILHTNGLATASLTKKCAQARDVLKSHNRPFEWSESRSASKATRSPVKANKCKCSSTVSPKKDVSYSVQPKRIMTSEKGTMFTQTTATRSTCTSAFIRKVDASTNTISIDADTELCSTVQRILDEMVPLPPFQLPIHEVAPDDCVPLSNACSIGSTQTDIREYRNQGTITRIQNVRKRVNYTRNDSNPNQSAGIDSLRSIKKEDIASPFGSMSNLLMTPHIPSQIAFTGNRSQQFLHLWILLGEILFPIADQSVEFPKPASADPKTMEKLQRIQSLLGAQPHDMSGGGLLNGIAEPCIDLRCDSGDENIPTASLIKESASDCSQDSIRSNESDRVNRIEVSDFGTLAAFVDDNSVDASHATMLPVPLVVKGQERANAPTQQETIHTNVAQLEYNIELADNTQHFKVPKRKPMRSIAGNHTSKRKRKTEEKVIFRTFSRSRLDFNFFAHSQTKRPQITAASNLFDDPPVVVATPQSMENIFEYFRCPEILSPIRELPVHETSDSTEPNLNATKALNELSIASTANSEVTPNSDRCESLMEIDENLEAGVETSSVFDVDAVAPEICDTEISEVDVPTNTSRTTVKDAAENASYTKESTEVFEPEIDFSYDYSPASPLPEQCPSAIPTIIPLHTQIESTVATPSSPSINASASDSSQSIFDHLIKSYSNAKRQKLLNNIKTCLTADESYTIASLRNSIETLCMESTEWTSATVTVCVEKMLKLTWRPMLLVKALLEVIEDTIDAMCYDFTPPSPAMTQTHRKCLLLIVRIEREIPSFMKYMEFQVDRNLFQFSQPLKLPAMINLTHLYIGLLDLQQPEDRSKVRLFIYKCLYYYTHKATPMIYAMLMAHPYVLPHANTVHSEADPLVRAIISVMTNIRYTSNGTSAADPMHRKNEMYNVLKRRYGYFADKSFPTDCFIDYAVECIRFGRLMNVDYALILVAKRQGCEWAVKSIIEKHLLPMLHTYVSGDIAVNTQNDDRIRSILFTIASIVKTFPLEQKIDYYLNIFVTCLNATDRVAIQEAAISAMCQLSRFGCAQIYPYISAWKPPSHGISSKLMAMLNTVVYQKNRNFWYASKG